MTSRSRDQEILAILTENTTTAVVEYEHAQRAKR
jgi:hypothetical protein